MKCANCGNTNQSSLFDDDDTIYCSKCCHRTSKSTGKDDLVICPICHHPRDRKAAYCMWCNGPEIGKYNPVEEKLANEYQKTITDDNLRYRKFKNFDSKDKKNYSDNNYEYQNRFSNFCNSTAPNVETIENAIGLITGLGIVAYGIGKGIYTKIKNKGTQNTKKKYRVLKKES